MKTILTLTGFALLPLFLAAQGPLGKWTSYLPYNRGQQVAISGSKVFCTTEGGLFYFDKSDQSINTFNKEDGLSDSDISAIAASSSDILIIAYANANLDIIENNVVYNLSDIQRKIIPGDKKIYSITTFGNDAFLATGFGIIRIDLEKKEIKETYYIGELGQAVKVNDIEVNETYIYAATEKGIYRADLSNPNLIDYSSWSRLTAIPGYDHSFNSLAFLGDKLLMNKNYEGKDSIYSWDGLQWNLFTYQPGADLFHLQSSAEGVIICSGYTMRLMNEAGQELRVIVPGEPRYAVLDQEAVVWIADNAMGLVRNSSGSEMFAVKPDGPTGRNVTDLAVSANRLAGVAGGTTSNYANLYRQAELYFLKEKAWKSYKTADIRDLYKVCFHPENPDRLFIGTWGYGILEFNQNELVQTYNESNSTLRSIIADGPFIRCGGLVFDKDQNLWVGNSGVQSPISVRKKDGTWKSFEVASVLNAPNVGDLIISSADHLWAVLPGGYGLFVYDWNGTVDNTADDRMKKISVTDRDNKIITNEIYSIAEDRSGNIWLGTSKGVVVYYSAWRVFDSNDFYAQQITVPRNDGTDYGDILLGQEIVTAIAVDGANRKWLGTKNGGVFLVSDDGLKQVHSFSTTNSPLLSNSIQSIAINNETGEVFFGTDNGIISFISDATSPDEDFTDVYVYPNPVREDYFGPIVISGLIEDTWVKITDLNGNLVSESKSLGGQAVWDGKNFRGDRVSTGVYLVFLTNDDGTLTHVTKLLFIH